MSYDYTKYKIKCSKCDTKLIYESGYNDWSQHSIKPIKNCYTNHFRELVCLNCNKIIIANEKYT